MRYLIKVSFETFMRSLTFTWAVSDSTLFRQSLSFWKTKEALFIPLYLALINLLKHFNGPFREIQGCVHLKKCVNLRHIVVWTQKIMRNLLTNASIFASISLKCVNCFKMKYIYIPCSYRV